MFCTISFSIYLPVLNQGIIEIISFYIIHHDYFALHIKRIMDNWRYT